ncbi:hypothetical protein NDU88_006761 [Pleurodeles waltl]|uniref:Uncharacterized protein n=1 Tax=Pleurodeles waltl TaxID=8319 RepID=A0AAV7PJB2_PLEWA|nr:hypothetical protein NDU88_006761 [Pleurodeles waltl]
MTARDVQRQQRAWQERQGVAEELRVPAVGIPGTERNTGGVWPKARNQRELQGPEQKPLRGPRAKKRARGARKQRTGGRPEAAPRKIGHPAPCFRPNHGGGTRRKRKKGARSKATTQ